MSAGRTESGWSRLALPWLLLLATGLATAWLRYRLIEPSVMVDLCSGNHDPVWCTLRQWLVLGFLHNVYATASLVATALALLWKSPWMACLAAALGIFALELYSFEVGTLALLIGCLRLLRLQAQSLSRTPPIEQHRQRDQQIQSQP